jgi:hypothetical protein
MTNLRTVETGVAKFTLVALAIFAPLETIASWQMFGGPGALIHPGYLGSVAGMLLLLIGSIYSLRARPRRAPGLMCASHAWWAGVGWHAASLRMSVTARGEELFYGSPEMWAVLGGLAVTLAIFAASLFLTYRVDVDSASDATIAAPSS